MRLFQPPARGLEKPEKLRVYPRSILSLAAAAASFFGTLLGGYLMLPIIPLIGYPALALSLYLLAITVYVARTPFARIQGERIELFTVPKFVLYTSDVAGAQLFLKEQKLVIDTRRQGEKPIRLFFMEEAYRDEFLDRLAKMGLNVSEVGSGDDPMKTPVQQ